ncbi:glycoside hydrolase family 3 protein [Jiangella aurantiaca]|uniref:glycoside hydrolase family 3 protein n=1 Tax=Jiangella aurantiaca TaxID=2530373 RepID=UPI0013A5BE83|nr:glycoside hydrolase family 3 N-terminal domain-containing protein [Jiangella aurantiaca]
MAAALTCGLALAAPSMPAQAEPDPTLVPPNACRGVAASLVARMTPRERIGQLLMGQPARSGALPDEAARAQIQDYGIGSFITQNSVPRTPDGAAVFHNRMQAWAQESRSGVPLFIGMDLENGTVQQIPVAAGHPFPMGLGATRDPAATSAAARVAGTEAEAIGINWSFGPVADLNTNPENPVIGVRSFGADDTAVAPHTAAYAVALQEAGVLSAAKHFPGHGDTSVDSHTGLPTVEYEGATLDRHLTPFRSAFDAGSKGAMTAHVVVEAVDPDLPATLSPKVLTGLLRGELGFDGVVVTDSMAMDAIRDTWGLHEAAAMAIEAGADIVMVQGDARPVSDFLVEALDSRQLSAARVRESATRVVRTKCEMGLWGNRYADPQHALTVVGTPEAHQQGLDQAVDSMTLLDDDGVALPVERDARILVAGRDANRVAGELTALGATAVTPLTTPQSPSAAVRAQAVALAADHDVAVVTTFTSGAPNAAQAQLLNDVAATGTPTVAVSLGLPYDLAGLDTANARLATYAQNVNRVGSPEVYTGIATVLLGDRPATGRLPVPVGGFPIGHGSG